MTKEELKVKVDKQLSIINDANDEICSYVKITSKVFHTRLATKLAVPDAMFVGLQVSSLNDITVVIMARLM